MRRMITWVVALIGLCGLTSAFVYVMPRERRVFLKGNLDGKTHPAFGIVNLSRPKTSHPAAAQSENNESSHKSSQPAKKKLKKDSPKGKSSKANSTAAPSNEEKQKKKEEVMRKLKAKLEEKKKEEKSKGPGIFETLNPFQAGQKVRKALGGLSTLAGGLPSETRQKYYLDERLGEVAGGSLTERNPYIERLERDNFVPEVLVIGATGEVGRFVVRRLLLEGRFRVRVLVRDLYSKTLNLLGTGVTYCQGDLGNVESLEYALTDVDKIVFCAAAPRPDERDFQQKFEYYIKENLDQEEVSAVGNGREEVASDMEWEQLNSVLAVRAQLAEQVDFVGMQNLVRAYQNVRHADYGTSQAAKRSLFKFSSRPEDFQLFAIDEGDTDFISIADARKECSDIVMKGPETEDYEDEIPDEDPYADYYGDGTEYDNYADLEQRRDATVKTQVQWMRNEFGRGVFVGKVPKLTNAGIGGQSAIISSRLRSRENPENGIDLSVGFAGFIVRLVSDGGTYEAFVRTGAYEKDGIEYVCQFSTSTKPLQPGNKSRNKYMTVRLPFDNFKPVLGKNNERMLDSISVERFDGSDVRNIGFRYRSASNSKPRNEGDFDSFYLALSYLKVYRLQPEPEFVYLSDARIPPVVGRNMVRHDRRQLIFDSDSNVGEGEVIPILDEKALKSLDRSPEEIYFKFRGEEILKNSGLR